MLQKQHPFDNPQIFSALKTRIAGMPSGPLLHRDSCRPRGKLSVAASCELGPYVFDRESGDSNYATNIHSGASRFMARGDHLFSYAVGTDSSAPDSRHCAPPSTILG